MDDKAQTLENKIQQLLDECNLNQLMKLEVYIDDLIKQKEATIARMSDPQGRQNRREMRINTRIRAKIERISNISQGQAKEFTAYIEDISRHGMKLRITDPNYIHSKIIKVIFWGPKKTVKTAYMEVMRSEYCESNSEKWMELGCQSIKDEQVRRLRQTEKNRIDRISSGRKIIEINNKKNKRADIYLVGFAKNEQNELKNMISSYGYEASQIDNISLIPSDKTARGASQLALLSPSLEITRNESIITQLKTQRPNVAMLAIVENEDDAAQADPDGYLTLITMEEIYIRLNHYIKKALLHHYSPKINPARDKSKVLLLTNNQRLRQQIENHFNASEYKCHFVNDRTEAEMAEIESLALAIIDQSAVEMSDLSSLSEYYYDLPVISLANDWEQCEIALTMGISNYLLLPLEESQLTRIFNCYRSADKDWKLLV